MLFNYSKIKFAARIINRVFRGYKKRVFLVSLLGILAGFSGSIGIGAIIPLFSLLTDNITEASNILTGLIKGFFSFLHIPFNLPILVSLVAVLLVLKSLIQFFARYINDKTGAEYEEKLRTSLLRKTLSASWPYLLNQKSGYLERIILYDVSQGATLIILTINFILFITSFITYAFIAFSISSAITLLTIVFGILLFVVSKPLFSRAKKMGRQMAEFEKDVSHSISQSLIGAKMIKAEGVEYHVAQESRGFFKMLKLLRIKMAVYQYSLNLAFEPIGFIFIAVLFVFYYNSPNFDIISFGAVVYLVQKMFSFIQSAQNNVHRINEVVPYVETIIRYRAQSKKNEEDPGGPIKPVFKNELSFKDIEFYYEKGRPVFTGVNFSIRKGQMVGIVGSSGSGKTTLVDLLLGFFQPVSGDIMLDGRSIREFNLKSWRKKFSYVSQDVFLLNDTIRNNIRFYDNSVSDRDIVEAVEIAQLSKFIEKLPDGLDTEVGERGLKISGGQRQRIALARALASKPDILILDEATSSLDPESEFLIQKAVDSLKGKITVLAIAHRMSTVINSDKLIILDKGRMVEEGIPAQLLGNKNSYFYKMYHQNNKADR